MKSYVGLDVHSKSSVFVIQDERGEEVGRGEVPTSVEGFSLLRLRFRLRASTLVALESGTMAFFAARRLTELGLSPVVVDAREVRMKAHWPRQKSDTRDAVELCEGIRRGIYRAIVDVPPGEIEHLRNTVGTQWELRRPLARTDQRCRPRQCIRAHTRRPTFSPGRLPFRQLFD
jgi:transposase